MTSSNFFVGTLGTLGQHDYAFGFSGSIGVVFEFKKTKSLVVGACLTAVFMTFAKAGDN